MAGFLDSVMSGGSDLVSSAFNSLIAAATGGFKGRPQWRDLEFMNDAQNRLWPDEIKRQGQFLEGLAPSQATAYNTQQDMTFGEDTRRQQERTTAMAPTEAAAYNTYQDMTAGEDARRKADSIKTMSSSLGMSPWEITGTGSSTGPSVMTPSAKQPSPSGGGQQGQSPMGGFLQGLIPLQTAKMANLTQLQIAKMSNDTSRYIADQQTGKGALPQAQIEQIASNIALQDIQHANGMKDLDIKNQGMVVQMVQTLAQLMPKDTLSIPGLTSTNTPGWQKLAKTLFKDNQQFIGDAGRLNQALNNLPPDAWGALKQAILDIAEQAAKGTEAAVEGVGGYLSSLTKK